MDQEFPTKDATDNEVSKATAAQTGAPLVSQSESSPVTKDDPTNE